MHVRYWWESQKEREHWEGQDVGGWTILKWNGVDWIDMAQDTDQWRALVNTAAQLAAPQEGLSSVSKFCMDVKFDFLDEGET
jgi:hypothetical protein